MATKIDIANQALSLLGAEPTITSIDPPDGSPEAGNVSRWYPVAARRLAEEYDWSFLTKAVKPALIGGGFDGLYGFDKAYRVPSDNVRMIGVFKDGKDIQEQPYKIQVYDANDSLMILTNEEDPVVRYVAFIDKPTLYPQYFVECLVLLLAIYLVGPMKESNYTNQTLQGLMRMYEQALQRAKAIDAQTTRHSQSKLRVASHLRARGV